MFKKFLGIFLFISLLLTFGTSFLYAQGAASSPSASVVPTTTYYKAKVIRVVDEGQKIEGEFTSFYQTVEVEILDGDDKGKKVKVDQGGLIEITPQQLLKPGDSIVLLKTDGNNKITYTMLDRYRLDYMIYIMVGFFALVAFIAGKKGLGAIIGLGISLAVVLQFIVPLILKGYDPVLITIIGSLFIMLVTMYLAHGFTKKITVAIIATLLALLITGVMANLFVGLLQLSGLGSEDSFLLQMEPTSINMRGLLLAGIIIGALGVLDDITSAQAATIFELHNTDKSLSFSDLFKKGFNVGKEHIAALVNTLVLAYAGASLSLFILFVINPANQPYWVLLNSEIVVEEVIRTLAGSIGLILAVPITTALAAYVASSKRFNKNSLTPHRKTH